MPKNLTQPNKIEIPKLRFPGFEGVWEEKKLGYVTNIIMGQSPESNFYNTDGLGKYLIQGNADISNRKTNPRNWTTQITKECNIGDIIMTVRAPVGYIARSLHNAVVGRGVCAIKNKENSNIEFIYQFLLQYENKWEKYSQGSTFTAVSSKDVQGLKINIPQPPEQQKIASFLSEVDTWIENLREQKKSLESYKKSLMQKIFSQQIRFKDEKGNDFPEWEEKKLAEIGKSYNGLSGKNGEDFGEGEPFITYKQIFDSSELDVDKFALVKIGNNEKQNRAKFGDVFFTTSSETPLEVGFASVLLNKEVNPYLNSFSFGFRFNSLKDFDPYFAKFFFRTSIFRRDVVKLAQGSTRYNISKIEFMKMKFNFPLLPEQQKIALFLSSVDTLLESKQQQITKAEEWKKGLMQGLFV